MKRNKIIINDVPYRVNATVFEEICRMMAIIEDQRRKIAELQSQIKKNS